MTASLLETRPSRVAFDRAPQVAWRLALLSIGGFWAFYFVLNTLRNALAGSEHQWAMIERRSAVSLVGIVLTLVVCLILRRLEGRSMGVLVTAAFLAAVPVSIAYAAFNYMAFYVVAPLESTLQEIASQPKEHVGTAFQIFEQACEWYFFVVAWAVLYVALSYAAKVRQAERRAALYRAEAQTAELRALRYQINPHFLFNTLNSLSTLILSERLDEAERMILNLATFFRTSLTADPTEDIPLGDEVRMQRLYLDIEQTRFPDRLRVEVKVPRELDGVPVPGLILQPLVENAIKHGVTRSLRPVTISIRARASDDRLYLTVEDDGDPTGDAAPGHGVGLRNVRERLAARFDGGARASYGPKTGGGFRVDIMLPLHYAAVRVT